MATGLFPSSFKAKRVQRSRNSSPVTSNFSAIIEIHNLLEVELATLLHYQARSRRSFLTRRMSRVSGAPSGEGYLPNMVTTSSSCASALLTERQSLTRRKGSARYGTFSARAHRAFHLSRRSDYVKVSFRSSKSPAEVACYSFLPTDYVAVKNLTDIFSH